MNKILLGISRTHTNMNKIIFDISCMHTNMNKIILDISCTHTNMNKIILYISCMHINEKQHGIIPPRNNENANPDSFINESQSNAPTGASGW